MIELSKMGDDLEMYLDKKELFIGNDAEPSTLGKIQNIKTKILFFRQLVEKASTDPALKSTIINDFAKTKEEILSDINSLKRG